MFFAGLNCGVCEEKETFLLCALRDGFSLFSIKILDHFVDELFLSSL